MMERSWRAILARYGGRVTVGTGAETEGFSALVQPLPHNLREGEIPTPLGLGRGDRYLYLGPADHPLTMDSVVIWRGRDYRVQSACLAGAGICPHVRAVLYPREEERP